MRPKFTVSTGLRTILIVVICISFFKLVLCLWYNGPRNNSSAAEREVNQWLDSLNLSEYKDLFRQHGEWIVQMQ